MNIKRFLCYIAAVFISFSTALGMETAKGIEVEENILEENNIDEAKKAYNNQDYKKALKIARELAEQNDAEAQILIGVCYEYGKGVEQSYTEAAKWYTLAAEQGVADAQYMYTWRKE